MTASLLTELVRVKVLFQQRAILTHMGVDPAMTRHLTQPTGEAGETLSMQPSLAGADAHAPTTVVGPTHFSSKRSDHARSCLTQTDRFVLNHEKGN